MGNVKLGYGILGGLSTDIYHGLIEYKKKTFRVKDDAERIIWYASYHGISIIRVLPFAQWWTTSRQHMFQPFELTKENKFDLEKLNDNYFECVIDFIKICKKYKIKLMFSVFDSCGLFHNQPKRLLNPWANNLQGQGHFIDAESQALSYVERCIKEFEPHKIYWEFCNEYMYPQKEAAIKFALKVFKLFKKADIPAKRLNFGAHIHEPLGHNILLNQLKRSVNVGAIYGEDPTKYGIGRNMHGFDEYIDILMENPHLPWVVSDDGKYQSEGFDYIPPRPDRRRPTPEQWEKLMGMVLPIFSEHLQANWIFEHCPKTLNEKKQIKTLSAMSEAFKIRFGEYPENWQKYEYKYYEENEDDEEQDDEIEDVEPVIPDGPPVIIPKKETKFQQWWNTMWKKYWWEIVCVMFIIGLFIIFVL